MNIPDNYDLYRAHEAQQEAALAKCPICAKCGNHITDDYGYDVNGDTKQLFCWDCAVEWLESLRVNIEDLESDFWEES